MKTTHFSVDWTATEAAEFQFLAARFRLTDAQLGEALARYALALAQGGADGPAVSLEEFLNQKIAGIHALMDEVRLTSSRVRRVAERADVVKGLVLERVAGLPVPARTPTG